jgi:thiol-disulfide isomerase/thioredoxin
MQLSRFGFTAIVLAAISCLPALASTLTVGQPAPALTLTDLLQAPAGAKTDWPSLHGKVVVLEFWATWCSGCIEEIPHLNSLIQSLDPAKVQFIAVDDEDPALVKKFLVKTPINGWLGLDTSKKIIDSYDAQVRPRTVVVDPQGKIAAILNPTQLTKEQLQALAEGKPITFPGDVTAEIRQQALKEAKAAADAAGGGSEAPKPLFDISIRPGDPAGRMAIAHRPGKTDDSYTYDFLNATVKTLMQYAGGVAGGRLVIHGGADTKYSLHVGAPGGDFDQLAPAIQLAIVTATGMKMSHVSSMEDVYVLQATPQAAGLLPPSTLKQSMCFYNAGKLIMMQASLDDLAGQLEEILDRPVVNESGLNGKFDANFDLPKGDVEVVKATLEKNLGLTLVKAKRSIDRTVLDAPPVAEKAADKSAPAGQPTSTTEKPAAPTQKP